MAAPSRGRCPQGGQSHTPEGPTTTYPEPRSPAVGAGLGVVGPEGRWLAAEAELCDVVGRAEGELAHSPVEDVVHPDDRTGEATRHRQVLDGALDAYRARVQLERGDGEPAWAMVDGRPALDAEGRRGGVLLVVTDVTPRRRLELGGVGWADDAADLEHATALVAVKDLDGTYLRVNRAFEERFRVSHELLRGHEDSYLFPPIAAGALRSNDALALRGTGLVEGRDALPLGDGDHGFAAFRFPLLGPAGTPCGVCAVWAEPEQRDAAAALAERLLAHDRRARHEASRGLDELAGREEAARRGALARLPTFLPEGLHVSDPPALAEAEGVEPKPDAPRPAAAPAHDFEDLARRLRTEVAGAATREQGATRGLALICGELGWDAGGCYLPEGEVLRCCAFWQTPGLEADGLETLSWQRHFSPGRDLVGHVAADHRALELPDLSEPGEATFRRGGPAAAAGLRSAMGFPIPTEAGLPGVVELFGRDVRPADPGRVEALATLGRALVGLAAPQATVAPVTLNP
jgi:PAS domain S-box-containing protein